jgi:pyruvate,water dikinase
MSGDLKSSLEEALKGLGGVVAVRSSSVSEDTHEGSAAGRYKTILRVNSFPDLVRSVEKVWGSAKGKDMAVIIQKQLEPERSGVLFTRDPTSGEELFVIEEGKGTADDLVSGKIDPKRYAFGKDVVVQSLFRELIYTARYLEEKFGYPLDIEWAYQHGKYHILQARPITNLPPPPRSSGRTYSRVQAEQFYSGPVSPLFYSFFNLLHSKYYIGETIRDLDWDLDMEEGLIRHRGYLYVNTALAEFALTHFPTRGSAELLENAFPEDIRDELKSRKRKIDLKAVFKLFKFIMRNRRLLPWNLDRHFSQQIVPDLMAALDDPGDLHGMSLTELKNGYEKIMSAAILHVRTSKWGLALYLPPLLGAMTRTIENTGYNPDRISDLMMGLPENRTLQASVELERLSRIIIDDPHASKIFAKELSDHNNYFRELMSVPGGDLYVEYFGSIIKRFGHRRLSRDLLGPSWRDEPDIPFSILKRLVCDRRKSIGNGDKLSIKRRKSFERELKARLSFVGRKKFDLLSRYFVRYVTFREHQRFYLDMIISRMRELMMATGRSMVKSKILDRPDDIFFLDLQDVTGFLDGGIDRSLRNKAAFNRCTFENEIGTPGRFMRQGVDFDSIEPVTKEEVELSCNVITGQAISRGVFSGKVRVIPEIDSNISVERNDIIVTRSIDPGQTHVFLLAGALVLEVGGLLSHGAILAREFNLPTVAAIKNATGLFQDGQRVIVDGTKGEIVVEDG